jgi:hypothetical protein
LVDRAEVTDELVNFSDWGSPAVLFFNLADTARTSVSVDILRYGADLLLSRGASLTLLAVLDVVQHARSKSTGFASEECSGWLCLALLRLFSWSLHKVGASTPKITQPVFRCRSAQLWRAARMARPYNPSRKHRNHPCGTGCDKGEPRISELGKSWISGFRNKRYFLCEFSNLPLDGFYTFVHSGRDRLVSVH